MALKHFVIIVAGGSGSRYGSEIPKQFLLLQDKPILMQTLTQFYSHPFSPEIILVLPAEQIAYWHELVKIHQFSVPHSVVSGGPTRFHSVKNGLNSIETTDEAVVGVHDGVRPLVSHATITEAFDFALKFGNAIPVVDVHESVRQVAENSNKAVNRDNYKLVQTPQCFQLTQLKKAFETEFDAAFTDDASVAEKAGFTIFLTKGNRENIKITTPIDLAIAHALLPQIQNHVG